jgi:hypothetical protein
MIAAAAAAGVLRSADLLDVPNVALLRELRPAQLAKRHRGLARKCALCPTPAHPMPHPIGCDMR